MNYPSGITPSFASVDSLVDERKLILEMCSIRSFLSLQIDPSQNPVTFQVENWPDQKGGMLVRFVGDQFPTGLRKKLLDSAGADTVFYFNAFLRTAQLVFKSAFSGMDGDLYRFRIPDKIYRLQRRTHVRIEVRGTESLVSFQLGDPNSEPVRRLIRDISIGGVGIQGAIGDEKILRAGQIISELFVFFKGRSFKAEAEIRHVMKSFDQVRIGIRFKSLNKDDEKFIREFVSKEMPNFMKALGL